MELVGENHFQHRFYSIYESEILIPTITQKRKGVKIRVGFKIVFYLKYRELIRFWPLWLLNLENDENVFYK